MIKHKGNVAASLNELKRDQNNAVAFIYENAQNGNGKFSKAVFTIKDVYATIDAPTQASSLILKNFMPYYDAEVVSRIKVHGGAIVAKTHTDELALGGTGTYSAWGLITNPLDSERMIGGSSSGAAATFTDSISIALGSDTGDSVRIPASYMGINGFKPSYGAISRYGLFAFASSLDTVAYFGHNVSDIISVSEVLFGQDQKDMSSREVIKPTQSKAKPQTVAFLKNTDVLSEEVKAEYANLKLKLEQDGIQVNTVEIDEKLLKAIDTTYMVISFSEASSNDANLNGIAFGNRAGGQDWKEIMTNARSNGFGPMVQRRFALGSFYLQVENQQDIFIKAQKVRRVIVEEFAKIYQNNDLLIFPAASIAPKIKDGKKDSWYSSYLTQANLGGTPSLTLKWIKEENMPVGLSLDASLYSDARLLSHALYLEELLGGNHE